MKTFIAVLLLAFAVNAFGQTPSSIGARLDSIAKAHHNAIPNMDSLLKARHAVDSARWASQPKSSIARTKDPNRNRGKGQGHFLMQQAHVRDSTARVHGTGIYAKRDQRAQVMLDTTGRGYIMVGKVKKFITQ